MNRAGRVSRRRIDEQTTRRTGRLDHERVAKVVRNAERRCFVRQALVNPVAVTGKSLLNGRRAHHRGGRMSDSICMASETVLSVV